MAGLSIADLQMPLALTNTETPQPFDVIVGVEAIAVRRSPGYGQRPESLPEPKPTRGYAEFICHPADCPLLSKHAHSLPTIRNLQGCSRSSCARYKRANLHAGLFLALVLLTDHGPVVNEGGCTLLFVVGPLSAANCSNGSFSIRFHHCSTS